MSELTPGHWRPQGPDALTPGDWRPGEIPGTVVTDYECVSPGWIITGISDDVPESDPYGTKVEAESDRIGMTRFERADRRGDLTFIHGEPNNAG